MTERATQGERTPSCARPADVGARSPECAIRYEDVSFSYKAGTLFMEGLSAAIPAGAVTSIVGPNGCGKSPPAFCAPRRGGWKWPATTPLLWPRANGRI